MSDKKPRLKHSVPTKEEMEQIVIRKEYHEGLKASFHISTDIKEKAARADLRDNREKVSLAISELMKSKETFPTVKDIALVTGLSRTTVYKHLDSIRLEISEKRTERMEVLRENVLSKLYKIATGNNLVSVSHSDSIRAAIAFMKFTDSSNTKTTNYIQINNIYINQQSIETLPEEIRSEIEKLILIASANKVD